MSTGTAAARAALTMFDGMIEQEQEKYVESMINDNEDPTEMDYDLEETTTFVPGATFDPNPSKKKKKVAADLKANKKRNDGSRSHQSIGLDDEDDYIVITNGKATVPKDNRQIMGNKWEKKIELEKQETTIKWELEKAKTFGEIELEKQRLQFAKDAEDAKIILADDTHLGVPAKKCLAEKKKEINYRRAQEAARAGSGSGARGLDTCGARSPCAEYEARMQAKLTTHLEQDKLEEEGAWMGASGQWSDKHPFSLRH
ncbi:hypothetical protein D1007_28365 [Hordeum vulgare]|nr:hypothetical protein D1007_28365 [Hordeum vulgare]